MQTSTNKRAAGAAPDQRTGYARALDHAAAELGKLLPDRVPQGVPLELLADPSRLAALATEYSRRVYHRFGKLEGYRDTRLGEDLDRLPKLLRESGLTEHDVRALFARIAAKVDELENPEAPPAPDRHHVELARDLGMDLPATLEQAIAAIAGELACRDFGDARTAPLLRALRAAIGSTARPGADAIRARHALVGFGFPPVRDDDQVFAVERDVLAPPLPPLTAITWHRQPPDWLDRLAERMTGRRLPRPPSSTDKINRENEAVEKLRLNRRNLVTDDDREAARNHPASDAAERFAFERERKATLAKSADDWKRAMAAWSAETEATRAAMVAGVDQAIAEVERGQPGSLCAYWLRRLRALIAEVPSDIGDTSEARTGHVDLFAVRVVRGFGLRLAAAPAGGAQ